MRIKRSALVTGYVAALCAVAMILLLRAQFDVPVEATRFWNTLGALLALGVLAETFSLQLSVGTSTSSVSFVAYLAGILLLGPDWGMALAGISELTAETLIRRKPLIKVLHNTSKEVLAVGVAAGVYGLLGGQHSYTVFAVGIAPFLAATLSYFVVTNGATALAVSLSMGSDIRESWARIVGRGIIQHDLMASSLSVLLTFLYIELALLGLILVIVPLFFVRHAHHVNLKLEQANRELLELMVKSIEARDPYTSGHSVRVAAYAKCLARSLGLTSREIEQIHTAALLHDVGKIYEEFAPILRKEGKLTQEELRLMHGHPIRSADLVGTISALRGSVQECVLLHHENFDGTGYPNGVAGREIPLGARIIMIADTADAMTTDRPYRKALTFERVIEELRRHSGTQFDPELVEAFRGNTGIRTLILRKHSSESDPAAGPGRDALQLVLERRST